MAAIDYSHLKANGIIKQKQPDRFVVKVKVLAGNLNSEHMAAISKLAEKYGRGNVHLTTRQCIEIPHVHRTSIEPMRAELDKLGLELGAGGPRVRVITACPASRHCSYGLLDAVDFAAALDERFYGRGPLPHKFKMAVTGCPNSCAKPQENDLGFMAAVKPAIQKNLCKGCGACIKVCPAAAIRLEDGVPVIKESRCAHDGKCIHACPAGAIYAERLGWHAYAGGKIGRMPELGYRIAEFLTDEEALDLTEEVLSFYERKGEKRERLGDVINAVGFDSFEEAIQSALTCGVR